MNNPDNYIEGMGMDADPIPRSGGGHDESSHVDEGTIDFSLDEQSGMDIGGSPVRTLKPATVITLLALGLSIAGLYSMRTLSSASAVQFTTGQYEQMVNGFLEDDALGGSNGAGAMAPDAVFASLDTDTLTRLQVPLQELSKNPFMIYQPIVNSGLPKAPEPTGPSAEQIRREQIDAWMSEITRLSETINLKSILGGGRPSALANINGQIVQQGDRFMLESSPIEFVIRSIDPDSIVIHAENTHLQVDRESRIFVKGR